MRGYPVELNYWKQASVKRLFLFLLITVFAGMTVQHALGQTTTGSIYGTITDLSGAVIGGARVTVTNTQTGISQTALSNDSGNYLFPVLPTGDYSVSVEAKSFGTSTQNGIHLDVSQNVNTSFQLQPGTETQSVTVSAAGALIETRESQLSATVDQKQIEDLPLNGREAYSLVQLVPGVTTYSAQSVIGDFNGTKFSVNGNRTNEDSYYIDGAFDTAYFNQGGNIIPNPDALQEFRLLTNDFDAEYGRFPGGVVNVITRSGNNNFHGLVYDYFRNSALNLKSYFNTSVTPLKQNQFGGNFGGPIIRDKAFFFFSYEGLRVRTPTIIASTSISTPTPAEAGGDFSALNPSNYPLQPNGTPYSCNGVPGVICPNLLDPVAKGLLPFVPLTNPTTGISPQQEASANTSANQYLVRGDYQLSSSHQLSGTYFTSHGLALNPGQSSNQILDYSVGAQNDTQQNVVLSDVWTLSPTKLNTFRPFYTLSHAFISQELPAVTWSDLGSTIGYGALPASSPIIAINGYFQMGLAPPGNDNAYQQSFGAEDVFNWTAGNHAIKFGGSFFWNHYMESGSYLGGGEATFTGNYTGNALADFLLGHAATFRQNNGIDHMLHNPAPSLFVQDDWRVTHRLTLNLGLRWEVFAPFTGQNDFGTFAPFVQSQRFPTAPLGLLSAGDPGVPDGIIKTAWKNFAPRVGFAYDIFGNGKTAFRGSYGIFYAARAVGQITNTEQQPFILDNTISDTPNMVAPYAPNSDPFPYLSTPQNPIFFPGATLSGLPPGAGFPYAQEYNLTVEQALSNDWSARIAYVGSVGRKFFISRDENEPVYIPGASTTTAGLDARRPYEPTPNSYVFGAIVQNDDAGNSSYNALQATLTKRFTHGVSLSASYVWSKSMDISSIDPANITLTLSNQNNIRADWARSDYDIPQVFVASYIWTTPPVHRWGIVGKDILSGWQLNGITTIKDGTPFTVTSGVDSNLDGINTDRPNVISNPILHGGRSRQAKIGEFFDTAAFAQVPAGMPYGDSGRNSQIGPGFVDTDLSAFKNIPVWRESNLQFRAEFYNLFNNVNLGNPNAVMTSPLFGQISSLATGAAPRVIQFALKLSF
jgi:Carboxypeptidase regulatory-like domain/TonB-dependent Receptor Plug Domain